MNTTYASKINPQFSNAGTQDVSVDLSGIKKGYDVLIKENENELKALRNIAQDQSQIEFNRGAAKLVNEYGTDFKGLNKAMGELQDSLAKKLQIEYPDIAADLMRQYDSVRLRAVDAAHKKYISDNNEKLKAGAKTLLDSFKFAMPDDIANYMYQQTLPEEERDMEIVGRVENNLTQIDELLERKDINGNYIFSESDRKNRASIASDIVSGAKIFVSEMNLEQLKKWDENTFQREREFRNKYNLSKEDYDKLDAYVKNRRKELDKEDERQIKTQAAFNLADILAVTDADNRLDELKNEGVLPEKLINMVGELNKKAIETKWYDPDKQSDSMAFIDAISEMGKELGGSDGSLDSMLKGIESTANLLSKLYDKRDITNMSDEQFETIRNYAQLALKDKTFNERFLMDLSAWTDAIKSDIRLNPDNYPENYLEEFESEEEKAQKKGTFTPTEQKMISAKTGYNTLKAWFTDYNTQSNAKILADKVAADALSDIEKQISLGNMDSAVAIYNRAKYDYAKAYNSFWIPGDEFDRMQRELEDGKKPIYFHKGVAWEYLGVNGPTVFKVKI